MPEDLKATNFIVGNEQKLATQDWVRTSIIPSLLERDYGSERALNALHSASTWRLTDRKRPSKYEVYKNVAAATGALEGVSEKNSRKAVFNLMERGVDGVEVHLPTPKARGRYRELVDLEFTDAQGPRVKVWVPRYMEVHTRAGLRTYVAPEVGVDRLMQSLCTNYDQMQQDESDVLDTAMNLAYFYTVGELMIHPYIDGNHRAFDRFLEYGFAKSGNPISVPQDETGNIPATERFRVWTTNNLTNFLQRAELPLITYGEELIRFGVDRYQFGLEDSLQASIQARFTNPVSRFYYAGVAGEMLKWAGMPQEERIAKIQADAGEEGGFHVVHLPA